MKTESRLFGITTFSLVVFAAVYGWWTWKDGGSGTEVGQVEPIGLTALILSASLCGMCWAFFAFVARRIDPRPEDRADGEIADAAGEVGFFSPGSYWPFGLALAATVSGVGLVFMMWWLVTVGMVAVLVATCGLLFEYYTGTRRPETE